MGSIHVPRYSGKLFAEKAAIDFYEFENDDRMNHPKLTRNEELLYGRIVNLAQGVEERRLQLQRVFARRNITDEEVAHDLGLSTEKLVSIKHQGQVAEMTLIKCHFRLVKNVAEMFTSDSMSIKELVNPGVAGLRTAIHRFDPELKLRLATSAAWWIRDAMNKFMAGLEGLDLASFHIWRKMVAYENEFRTNFGKMPTAESVATALKVSPEKIMEIRGKKPREINVNFDQKIDKHSTGRSRTLGDVLFVRHDEDGEQ